MSKHALLNVTPFETRLVITNEGRLDEVFIERARKRSLVGDIYLGTVIRVLPAMGSVFVDIGRQRSAFLSQSDITLPHRASLQDEVANASVTTLPLAHFPLQTSFASTKPIKSSRTEPLPRVGERVVVQVTKDEYGTKGARVTMHIALAGRYLVYLPTSPKLAGVSTRITKKSHRARLKAHLDILLAQSSLMGGIIARSACKLPLMQNSKMHDVPAELSECLQADLAYLGGLWDDISQARRQASLNKAKFALLHQELPLPERALRDILTEEVESVWVDDKAAYERLLYASQQLMPSMASSINHHDDSVPLFGRSIDVNPSTSELKTPSIETQLEHALSRHCPLPSGGYLIIEHTEAMTTIDVNTGSFVGRGRVSKDMVFHTNQEAASIIAREIRVRNIAGIIIIDFIDMSEALHRQQVLDTFFKALQADPATTNITQISELGLVEMTRKRTHPSLSEELCMPCPSCDGTGRIKSVETVAFEVLRAVMSKLANITISKQPTVTIKTSQIVADYLQVHQDLMNLQHLTNAVIRLDIDASYHQEQYIILVE